VSERSPRRLGVRALVCACALAARAQALAGDDPPATSTPTSTAAETPAERGREDEPVELPEVLVRVPRAEARADPAAAASVVSADRRSTRRAINSTSRAMRAVRNPTTAT